MFRNKRSFPLPTARVILAVLAILLGTMPVLAQRGGARPSVPAPAQSLGFAIGEDRQLAGWDQFLAYYRQLDQLSDRMQLEELGKTTLNRPFVVMAISSPENLRQLDSLKEIQRQLSDPRQVAPGDTPAIESLMQRGRAIVVITCSIHSTEVGGTMTATALVHRLLSGNTPEIERILDQVVLFLVPSLNPDGTDLVTKWYRQTLGTPAEGASPPELYHHYTGHDNNRDWYAFTQIETQLMVDKLLNVWRPQIWHDIHQMGGTGARFFLPPYLDPWEPNIDPALIAGVNALGTAMAWEMTGQGKTGVLVNGIFDAWSPARAYAHYHAGLRILSETASARLATPVEISQKQLLAGANYDPKRASWNYPLPWPGGKWSLRDIVDYQSSGAMALLGHAARYREKYLRNFYEVSRRAVEAKGQPYAFLLPEPELPKSLSEAFNRLTTGLKNVTGTEEEKHEKSEALVEAVTHEPSSSEEVSYYFKTEGIDRLLAILKRGGVEVWRAAQPFVVEGKSYPAGTHIVPMRQPYGAFAKTLLEIQRYPDLREYPGGPPKRPYDVTAHTLPLLMNVKAVEVREPFTVESRPEPSGLVIQSRVRSNGGVRVGLYRNYQPSMDEGWTRWVFDQYKFGYVSLVNAEVRAGNLRAKYDAIILPDQSPAALKRGLPGVTRDSQGNERGYPAEFAGGLGDAGIQALKEFVDAGGTLIAFNEASLLAIEEFDLPVRNVLKGVSARDFYCPGSILRLQVETDDRLSFGIEPQSIAWFENSPAFEVTDAARARVIAKYPETGSPLLSGWILGESLLRGRAALVDASYGKGRVILFGFRPQYRGQSLATYPFIFNALLTSQ